jgi:hypothetical protein
VPSWSGGVRERWLTDGQTQEDLGESYPYDENSSSKWSRTIRVSSGCQLATTRTLITQTELRNPTGRWAKEDALKGNCYLS